MLHKTTWATILSIFSALAPISCLALPKQAFTQTSEQVPSILSQFTPGEFIRREPEIRTAPLVLPETKIPPLFSPIEFLGVSYKNRQEALSLALGSASRYVGISPRNAERELLYKVIKEDSGMNGGSWIFWIIIELIPNPNYHPPQIHCPENSSCDPIRIENKCFNADARRCGR